MATQYKTLPPKHIKDYFFNKLCSGNLIYIILFFRRALAGG